MSQSKNTHTEQEKKPKILFLASWYPHRYDSMYGLFVKRHAETVSEIADVAVIYLHQDEHLEEKKYEIDSKIENGITTVRIYYRQHSKKLGFLAFLGKSFRYLRMVTLAYRTLNTLWGKPQIVHLHVITVLGVKALLLKWLKKIPYVATEHWSRYLFPNGDYMGNFGNFLTKLIVKNASVVTAVTDNLRKAMINKRLLHPEFVVLPNVVDIELFHPADRRTESQVKTIVHVSCFEDKSKNISGLLRVAKRLAQKRDDFVLKLVGDGRDLDEMHSYSKELDIPEKNIVFEGLKEGKELVDIVATADFMVLFSNYETFAIVIYEALACGIPVLATNVGGISEHIDASRGILVEPGHEDSLLEKLDFMLDNAHEFAPDVLRSYVVSNFSKSVVAGKIKDIYQKALKDKNIK